MWLVLALVMILLVLVKNREGFKAATMGEIGPRRYFTKDPDVEINFPKFESQVSTKGYTKVLHSENFKFPEKVYECLRNYIKRYTKEDIILDDTRNIYFKDDSYIFDMNIVFRKYIFSKRYNLNIRIMDEACEIISINEIKHTESEINQIYGKLDNRKRITNILGLSLPFV